MRYHPRRFALDRVERALLVVALLAAIALAATGCANGNAASETGWHDHNLDYPTWEQ
jgi:hypothetical protein